MIDNIRQKAQARGLNAGRVAARNHVPLPVYVRIPRGTAIDIVRSACTGWQACLRWLVLLGYYGNVRAWYESGWRTGHAMQTDAATRARRIVRYRVVTTSSQGA